MVTIEEILLERGRRAADARRQQGANTAQLFSNLGTIAAGAVQQYAEHKADEPRRKDADRMRGLELRSAEQRVAEGDREAAEAEQDKRRDAQFVSLFQMYPDGNIPDREVLTIYGPQRGTEIAQGLKAFGELQMRRITNARETAGRLAIGVKALSPELQTQFWPSIREASIAGGLGTPEDIPEQPTPEYLDAVIGWSSGEVQQPAKLTYGPLKKVLVDGKPQLVREASDGRLYTIKGAMVQSDDVQFPEVGSPSGSSSTAYSEYLDRVARELGKPSRADLTREEEEEARATFYELSRADRGGGGAGRSAGRSAAANPRGSGSIPQGVEAYILDMRRRGYTADDAIAEMLSPDVWANMQRDHPAMTAQRVRQAILQLIPEGGLPVEASGAPARSSSAPVPQRRPSLPPSRPMPSQELPSSSAASGRGLGAGAASIGTPAAGLDEYVMTRQEFEDAIKVLREMMPGLSEAEARRNFEQRGYRIR